MHLLPHCRLETLTLLPELSYTTVCSITESYEAHPGLLPSGHTGLASGWGLDRLAMLVKGIDDIRLLRNPHPEIAAQMTNLEPYCPVSNTT